MPYFIQTYTENINDVCYSQWGRWMGWRDRTRWDNTILMGSYVMPRLLGENNTSLDSMTLFIDATSITDILWIGYQRKLCTNSKLHDKEADKSLSTWGSCRPLDAVNCLFNAVIVPNAEPRTTTLCLQQSYAGNNAILVRKGKSNGPSLFSLQFAVHVAHCCTSRSSYNVIQFNNYMYCLWHICAVKGDWGIARSERGDTWMRREAWAKGKEVNGGGNPAIEREMKVITCPVADWPDTPAGSNGLVL
jgi:hypothetical protein